LAAGFSAILSAQSISDLNKRRQKAEEEIAYIDKLLKKNTSDRQNSRQQIALTQQKIKSRKQIIADMDAQIHLLENDLGRKQDDVAGLQANLGTLKQSYEELLYQAYKHRDKRLWLMFLLSSNDAGLAYRRWQYFKNYAKYINEQALKIRETSERLNTEIVSLNEKKEQLATQKSAREKEMTKLTREEAEAQRMIKNLASKEKELARRMADQRKAIERINKQIEKIIADQTRQDQQRRKQTPNLPEIDRALSSGFQNNRGNLPWPVRKGIITKRFGQHFDQVFKNIKLPPNNGIDISTEDHSAVYCIFEGTVSRVFQIPGMNNCVMVQHGEYYTLYCKLSKVGVKAGDKLKAGQSLGTVFTTDEGAELHFEVWKGTTRQNPELWLKK
jgi:septal ring factor EnvC (AmiA/AmiB activator)